MNGHGDPHSSVQILKAGTRLHAARAALILLHGRGGSADSMIGAAGGFYRHGLAILAPQADGYTWYPHRFIRPFEENELYLSSALKVLARLVADVQASGLPTTKVILCGFSEGACLALEYVARFPEPFGGVISFSGGLIGDDSHPLAVPHTGTPLDGVPMFLGSAQLDPHIPAARVRESASIFEQMGANVTTILYPGDFHAINADEFTQAQQIVDRVL